MSTYLYLDGSGDVAVSDLVTNIPGDLDVRSKIRAADYTPSAIRSIVGRWTTSTQRNYALVLNTNGTLWFLYTTDGTTAIAKASTVALGTTAGLVDNVSDICVRATHDVDNGAGGSVVTFYYGTDGANWTQLGNAVTTAATIVRADSTVSHRVGMSLGGSDSWVGRIYTVEIRSGIDGPIVASPDFTTWAVGDTSKADAQSNLWTLTGAVIRQDPSSLRRAWPSRH